MNPALFNPVTESGDEGTERDYYQEYDDERLIAEYEDHPERFTMVPLWGAGYAGDCFPD